MPAAVRPARAITSRAAAVAIACLALVVSSVFIFVFFSNVSMGFSDVAVPSDSRRATDLSELNLFSKINASSAGVFTKDTVYSVPAGGGRALVDASFSSAVAPLLSFSSGERDQRSGSCADGAIWFCASVFFPASPASTAARTSVVYRGASPHTGNSCSAAAVQYCGGGGPAGLRRSASAPGCGGGYVLLRWDALSGPVSGHALRTYYVCSAKAALRQVEGRVRLATFQLLDHPATLQNGGPTYSQTTDPPTRLSHSHRFAGGVPDDGDSPSLSGLFYLPLQTEMVSLQGSSLWSFKPAQSFHEIVESACGFPTFVRDSSHRVLGRFADISGVVCPVRARYSGRSYALDVSGFRDLVERAGQTDPGAASSLVRGRDMLPHNDVFSPQTENQGHEEAFPQYRQGSASWKASHTSQMGPGAGSDAGYYVRCASGAPLVTGDTSLRKFRNQRRQGVLEPIDANAPQRGFGESRRVGVKALRRVQRPLNPPAASRHPDRFRRLRHHRRRDGDALPSAARSQMALAATRDEASHQLEGASNAPSGITSFGSGSPRTAAQCRDSQSNGQLSVDVVCKSARWQGSPAVTSGGSSLEVAPRPRPCDQRRFRRRSSESASGRRQQMVFGPVGMDAQTDTVSAPAPVDTMGSLLSGRIRVAREQTAASVLVSTRGPRRRRLRRRSAPPVVDTQLVDLPSTSHDPTDPAEITSGTLSARHVAGAAVAVTALVAASAAVVRSSSRTGEVRSNLPTSSSAGGLSDPANAFARAYLEGSSVSIVRRTFQQQGFSASAVERLATPWESVSAKSTLAQHRKFWDTKWTPYCHEHGLDPFEYSIPNLCNYLDVIQHGSAAYAASKCRPEQHASFKKARAAIGSIWLLIHPSQPRAADHPHVKLLTESVKRTAPILPKYQETISLDSLFAYLVHLAVTGLTFASMPILQLRDIATLLLRLRLHARSADVAHINRIWTDEGDNAFLACMQGDPSHQFITSVRYDFPKNWRSRAGRFSAWKSLGSYMNSVEGYQPAFSLCCVRSAVETYWARTRAAPVRVAACPDRPLEPKRRLFISAFPDSETGLFFEVSSTTISNRIKAILDTVGIDVSKFQSHILRSASIAAARGHTDEALDSVLSRAAVSEKVFSSFYDLPISSSAGQLGGPGGPIAAGVNSMFSRAGLPAKRLRGSSSRRVSNAEDSSGYLVSDRQIAAMDAELCD